MTGRAADSPDPAVVVGELRTVALPGDPAPRPLRGTYRQIVASSIDDDGEVALSVELSDGSGALVLITPAGDATVLAVTGDPAPGGGRFAGFPELDLADGGRVLFRAALNGASRPEGLFLLDGSHGGGGACGSSLVRVAGSGRYVSFAQPTVVAAGAAAVSFAFLGRLPDGVVELEQHPAYEAPRVSLRTGATLPDGGVGGVVDDLSISRLGMALCVVAGVRRGRTRLSMALVVTTNVVSSGDRTETGAELPDHGRIETLLAPPAVCAQMGFVTLGLADGRDAVCTRPPLVVDPTVLLVSGAVAPGLGDIRIAGIGPPVCSSSAALQTPFGVTCAVTLDDGHSALWAGVFSGQVPMEGAAILPWVCGERPVDRPGLMLDALYPVKLGNDGTLLATAAGGVFVLPDLFGWYG